MTSPRTWHSKIWSEEPRARVCTGITDLRAVQRDHAEHSNAENRSRATMRPSRIERAVIGASSVPSMPQLRNLFLTVCIDAKGQQAACRPANIYIYVDR